MVKLTLLLVILVASPLRAQFASNPLNASDSSLEQRMDSLSQLETRTRHHMKVEFLKNDVAFGATLGMPGGLNFIGEGYYQDYGLRLEIGGAPLVMAMLAGGQCDLSFVLSRDEKSLTEFSLIGFRSFIQSVDNLGGTDFWGYGVGLGFDIGGFFLQVSIGHSWSYDRSSNYIDSDHRLINTIPMTVQIGYVH